MGRFSALVVLVVLATAVAPNAAQDWGDLSTALVTQISGLWQNGEMEFMGHNCYFSVRPKVKRWQLYFRGKMWCPGWAPFTGQSETRSRSGVTNKAVNDFVQKAIGSNLITQDQARLWLQEF
ncbi:unnamed protein product [Meganyctiphanes norvegica]|uniref:Anti-lipopolysaccharide factor n=1 Tax=Meganyctiphanes norvegica TaxID=48144 RepID=A0AAV2Q4Q0_MEGNR